MNVATAKLITVLLVLALGSQRSGYSAEKRELGSRRFRFDYGGSIEQLPAMARVRVWLPVPKSDVNQSVKLLDSDLPAKSSVAEEPKYGNRILYFEASASESGTVDFSTAYEISRREVRGLTNTIRHRPLTKKERKLFLSANRKVPREGKPLTLINGLRFSKDPLAIARSLYLRVDDHVRYDKSKPGYGHGDVLWVCDSRTGNCTDFHSLFISLSRAKGLPARFEIGFPLPVKRGQGKVAGYHCWASFFDSDKGWVPVDISEADKHPEMKDYYFGNLTENRVGFTIGRDIHLVPQQDSPPLNYFIYPHVEVDGKKWPRKKMTSKFHFTDL